MLLYLIGCNNEQVKAVCFVFGATNHAYAIITNMPLYLICCNNSQVKAMCFVFGATPSHPKEMYILQWRPSDLTPVLPHGPIFKHTSAQNVQTHADTRPKEPAHPVVPSQRPFRPCDPCASIHTSKSMSVHQSMSILPSVHTRVPRRARRYYNILVITTY